MPKNVDPDLLLQEVLAEVAADDEPAPTLAQSRRGCTCPKETPKDESLEPPGYVLLGIDEMCPLHGSGMDW